MNMNKLAKIAGAGAALLITFGLGTVAGGAPAVESTPAPAPAVTSTVTATPTGASVDPSCAKALDLAEASFDHFGRGFENSAGALEAVSEGDVAKLRALTEEMEGIRSDVGSTLAEYKSEAAQCRAAAGDSVS